MVIVLLKLKNNMKAIKFFTLLSLVFSLSCKKDIATTDSGNLRLEWVAKKNVLANSNVSEVDKIVAILDVKSYNAKTGEITFNNAVPSMPDKVGEWRFEGKVNAFNKGDSLFTLTYTSDILSSMHNEPVLHCSLIDKSEGASITTEKHRWYILSGYPYGKSLGDKTITDAEQLKSFKRIKANWDVFVNELKKAKKYID